MQPATYKTTDVPQTERMFRQCKPYQKSLSLPHECTASLDETTVTCPSKGYNLFQLTILRSCASPPHPSGGPSMAAYCQTIQQANKCFECSHICSLTIHAHGLYFGHHFRWPATLQTSHVSSKYLMGFARTSSASASTIAYC